MTFFNKKEDVLKIELTPHGRKLLSMGKFKPHSYTFLDDDILYDASTNGVTETNSQIKNRILSETPYMKPQTNYKGIDSKKSDDDNKSEQAIYLQQRIGSNNIAQKRAAGWQLTTLLGDIEGSSKALTGSTTLTQPIPQIEYEINYTMSLGNAADRELSENGLLFDRDLVTDVKPDGTYVDIETEQVLINVFEKNGFFHKESYEIEVYLFSEDEQIIDRKLEFYEQDRQIKNNILVDDDVTTIGATEENLTNNFVEYYMNILADSEIPQEDVCSGLRRLKAKEIYLDLDYDCPDRDDVDINIYGTRVTDLEDC